MANRHGLVAGEVPQEIYGGAWWAISTLSRPCVAADGFRKPLIRVIVAATGSNNHMVDASTQARLERLLDRTEIVDLVRFERLCRDQRDFAGMVGCYVPNAPVRTSWFDGPVEDFAEASRRKMASGSSQAKHWIMPARLEIKDGRALVESPAVIFDRMTFDGVEFDMFQYCRFASRVVKSDGGWKLGSFEGIYQRDRLETVDPRQQLPVDWDLIKTLRPSYKFMGYTQIKRGYTPNPELLGDDRPDLVQAFYKREQHWLKTGK
jgi:SnoaL-like domain